MSLVAFLGSMNYAQAEPTKTPGGEWNFLTDEPNASTNPGESNTPLTEIEMNVQFHEGTAELGTVYAVGTITGPDKEDTDIEVLADLKKGESGTLTIKHIPTKSGKHTYSIEIRTPYPEDKKGYHVFETKTGEYQVDDVITTFDVTDIQDSKKTILGFNAKKIDSENALLNVKSEINDDKYDKVVVKNGDHIIAEMEPKDFNINLISTSGKQGFEEVTLEYVIKGMQLGHELNFVIVATAYAENKIKSSFNNEVEITLFFENESCNKVECLDIDKPESFNFIVAGILTSALLLIVIITIVKKFEKEFELLDYHQEET